MPFYRTNAHEIIENYQKSFFLILLQKINLIHILMILIFINYNEKLEKVVNSVRNIILELLLGNRDSF